ncbi:peptide chain release factor N(5)-glutamine methyltransferase [Dokdonia sinensis]|uniref:peptide chain release factor N(5)-glutamine methyltransferase n=1 Tax=Dokdonia sinensis TaxID=2479847 RepID=A0A3M0GFQ5_9FLAO|nr:peptide chain release factor N(5)-glutamine methyltransferase [Dokdonia sinensis]RMB56146.1 peptide chain release factor N(5)-glutamine methyltransferase [Dokdonia sinensis]
MTVQEIRTHFAIALGDLYPDEEVASFCFLSFEHVTGMNRVEVTLSRNKILNSQQTDEMLQIMERLKRSEPIQYIIGSSEFYGLEFQVNRFTLIPRPETEELVDWVIKDHTQIAERVTEIPHNVLDIGTGSGCIAICIAKHLAGAHIEAVDISQNALETASNNASRNDVKVKFFQQDILAAEDLPKNYDIIVSNPPYVRELEKEQMRANVLNNEPEGALFVQDETPLLFYEKIGVLAFKFLNEKGTLYFEINEYLGAEMIALLKEIGFKSVELRKDMFGRDRMIKAMRE